MHACEKDPELFKRLAANPEAVAKEHGVALEPAEVEQLNRVHKLQTLVEEFKTARPGIGGPIKYPIDVAWKAALANHIIRYRPIYYPIFYPIFYPVLYRWIGGYPAPNWGVGETFQQEALRRVGIRRLR
jgi:hypothetical protein